MAKSYNSYNKSYNGGSYGVFTQDRDSYDAYKDLYGTGGSDNAQESIEGQDYSVEEALDAYKEGEGLNPQGFQESTFQESGFKPAADRKWWERIDKVKVAIIAVCAAVIGWLIFKKD